MKYLNCLLLACATLFVSCALRATRGVVEKKVSGTEAQVCLGKGEVKEGDKVIAFYYDCQSKDGGDRAGAYGSPCVKTKLGKGIVTKIFNGHYSVVEFDNGVKFSEGTLVEKQ